jgi:2-(1,2-epoxy-1,2-dihydrophenyl)acetyl-CoA isomerase
MSYETLIYECHEDVCVITLNRPTTLNALNPALRAEMLAALEEVNNDDAIRVVIFTGSGRGFCSGHDLLGDPPVEGLPPQNERLDELKWMGRQAMAVYGLSKPTIAAMNGIAVGAGMSLALACDLRVGSEKSRFKTVFLERANSTDAGMSFFLPRIIGYSRAADLIFTSRNVDAEEAYRMGLLDRLFPHDQLLEEAITLAKQMAFWPPMAMRSAKRVLQHNLGVDLEDALKYEVAGLVYARLSPKDMMEQALSFREKRPPKFTGE